MDLENVVVDAVDPQRLGRFWQAAFEGEPLTDEPGIFETRVGLDGGRVLDLCFQPVTEPSTAPMRLHLVWAAGARHDEEVDRLLALGARRVDLDGEPAETLLADPEGHACLVVRQGTSYGDRGRLAALRLSSGDPERDARFWSWLTGWTAAQGDPRSLRHPSHQGPVLELCPEPQAKSTAKNALHLDARLEAGEDADDVEAGITERGGSRLEVDWGGLPWRSYRDPSGNELCVLPAHT